MTEKHYGYKQYLVGCIECGTNDEYATREGDPSQCRECGSDEIEIEERPYTDRI